MHKEALTVSECVRHASLIMSDFDAVYCHNSFRLVKICLLQIAKAFLSMVMMENMYMTFVKEHVWMCTAADR